jgi:hypothetical protein
MHFFLKNEVSDTGYCSVILGRMLVQDRTPLCSWKSAVLAGWQRKRRDVVRLADLYYRTDR